MSLLVNIYYTQSITSWIRREGNVTQLQRFGVSVEEPLLQKFDRLIHAKGYVNRSEAIRDLMRDALVQQTWNDEEAETAATVSLVYNHHHSDIMQRLAELQHHALDVIVSSTHIHLDHQHCLEVLILRGRGKKIKHLADTLSSIKGVLFQSASFAALGQEF